MYTNYYSFLEFFKNIFQQNDEKCFRSKVLSAHCAILHFALSLSTTYVLCVCFFASHSAAHMLINEALNRA